MNKAILDRFFNNYLTMKDRRENTFTTYQNNMKQFYDYFQELLNINEEILLLSSITNDMIEDYVFYLIKEKNYSASTINNKINTWKSFFKYVTVNKKLIPQSPVDGIPQVAESQSKVAKRVKEVLTHDELLKIIENTYIKEADDRLFEFCSARDRFIISLMYTTGLRGEEILQSEFSWIEKIDKGYMLNIPKSVVKNKMDKRLPITEKVLQYYNEYMIERDKLKNIIDTDLIILSVRGKKVDVSAFNNTLKKLTAKAKIDKKITSHCARHYFSTNLTVNEESDSIINRIGGWHIDGMKENYCHDLLFDEVKIRVCNSLL